MTALEAVFQRVEKARISFSRHQIINIVAVSKYATTAQIVALQREGQRSFGENKVQDLTAKSQELSALPIEWHFVGALQTNKLAKLAALRPALIHSIESLAQAQKLNAHLAGSAHQQRVLLQINSANEPTKSGVSTEAARDTFQAIAASCERLKIEGVMSIGAHSDEPHIIRRSFEATQRIYESLRPDGAKTLSMGMSGDYEMAISCGANLLRLGSVLFA